MAKLNQQPLLQSSVSHDPSEIILICWFGAEEAFFNIDWLLQPDGAVMGHANHQKLVD